MSSSIAEAFALAKTKLVPKPEPDMSASYAALAEIERRKEARKDKGMDLITRQAIPTGFYSGRPNGPTTKRFLQTHLDPRHQGIMERLPTPKGRKPKPLRVSSPKTCDVDYSAIVAESDLERDARHSAALVAGYAAVMK